MSEKSCPKCGSQSLFGIKPRRVRYLMANRFLSYETFACVDCFSHGKQRISSDESPSERFASAAGRELSFQGDYNFAPFVDMLKQPVPAGKKERADLLYLASGFAGNIRTHFLNSR